MQQNDSRLVSEMGKQAHKPTVVLVFGFPCDLCISIESVQGIFHTDPNTVLCAGDAGSEGEQRMFCHSAKPQDQRN